MPGYRLPPGGRGISGSSSSLSASPNVPRSVADNHSLYTAGLVSVPVASRLNPGALFSFVPHVPVAGALGLANAILNTGSPPPAAQTGSGITPDASYSGYSYGGGGGGDWDSAAPDFDEGYDDSLDDSFSEEALGVGPAAPKGGRKAVADVKAKAKVIIAKAQATKAKAIKLVSKRGGASLRGMFDALRGWGSGEILGDATSDALSRIDGQVQDLTNQLSNLNAQDADLQASLVDLSQKVAAVQAKGGPGSIFSRDWMNDISVQFAYGQTKDKDANVQQAAALVSQHLDGLSQTVDALNAAMTDLQSQQQDYASKIQAAQDLQYQTAAAPVYSAPPLQRRQPRPPAYVPPPQQGGDDVHAENWYHGDVPDAYGSEDDADFADTGINEDE